MFVRVHCLKNVGIRSYSAPYSVQMREDTDQNNSEYGYFLRSVPSRDPQVLTIKEPSNRNLIVIVKL